MNGGIAIGGASEQYRLLNNEIVFHELNYDELRDAIVGLTDVLLLPGLNTIIDRDHEFLWSWLGELLLGRDGPLSTSTDREIASLAETAVRSALANVRPPTQESFDRSELVRSLSEHNAVQFLQHAHLALAYLAFPLLEAICRRACSSYVDLNGTVLARFPRQNGGSYNVSGKCSNVGDLLRLIEGTVSSGPLKSDLHEVLSHIQALSPGATDGATVVFDWRNSSLHGEVSLPTIGGTTLSLGLMIALDGVRDVYEDRRAAAINRAQWELQGFQSGSRWNPSPWSYYPPHA